MATRALRARGLTSCTYEELSHDVLHNRILRSTLHALLGVLSICELLHDSLVVDESSGTTRFRDFREDDVRMWKVFEDLVTEFYRREQDTGWAP